MKIRIFRYSLFILNENGISKQADLDGGWYEFEKDYFSNAVF